MFKENPELRRISLEQFRDDIAPGMDMDIFLNMDVPFVRIQRVRDMNSSDKPSDAIVSVLLGDVSNKSKIDALLPFPNLLDASIIKRCMGILRNY